MTNCDCSRMIRFGVKVWVEFRLPVSIVEMPAVEVPVKKVSTTEVFVGQVL